MPGRPLRREQRPQEAAQQPTTRLAGSSPTRVQGRDLRGESGVVGGEAPVDLERLAGALLVEVREDERRHRLAPGRLPLGLIERLLDQRRDVELRARAAARRRRRSSRAPSAYAPCGQLLPPGTARIGDRRTATGGVEERHRVRTEADQRDTERLQASTVAGTSSSDFTPEQTTTARRAGELGEVGGDVRPSFRSRGGRRRCRPWPGRAGRPGRRRRASPRPSSPRDLRRRCRRRGPAGSPFARRRPAAAIRSSCSSSRPTRSAPSSTATVAGTAPPSRTRCSHSRPTASPSPGGKPCATIVVSRATTGRPPVQRLLELRRVVPTSRDVTASLPLARRSGRPPPARARCRPRETRPRARRRRPSGRRRRRGARVLLAVPSCTTVDAAGPVLDDERCERRLASQRLELALAREDDVRLELLEPREHALGPEVGDSASRGEVDADQCALSPSRPGGAGARLRRSARPAARSPTRGGRRSRAASRRRSRRRAAAGSGRGR